MDSIAGDDLYTAQNTPVDLPIGSIMTIFAGTMTTDLTTSPSPPRRPATKTWITGSNGFTISTFGVVPEPATLSLLALGATLLGRRR